MKLLEKILGISKDIRAVFWKRGDRFEPMFRQGEMYDVDKVRVAVDGLLDCLSDSDTSNMALRFENDYVHLRQVKDVFMVVVVGGEMSYSETSILLDEVDHMCLSESGKIIDKIKFWR